MKSTGYLYSIATAAALVLAATASAQDLPSSVTGPYVEYERAVEAGDGAAAYDAARRAFEAGEAERIDRETLGLLAENFGAAAAALGNFERAYEIWRDAARLGERAGIAPADQAWREFNTARAAYQSGRGREARRHAGRAQDALQDAGPEDVTALGFRGELHVLSARLAAAAGDWGEADAYTAHALTVFAEQDRQPGPDYAMAHLLAAVSNTLFREVPGSGVQVRDPVEGGYHARMAELMFSGIGGMERLVLSAREMGGGFDELDPAVRARLDADPLFQAHYVERVELLQFADPATLDLEVVADAFPRYPAGAARAFVQGMVFMSFDVDEAGRVDNVEILSGFPAGVFDEAALEAIAQWRYEPAIEDGQPVRSEGHTTHFQFRLVR
ncbi:energy transducer TonB [Maricaulis sp.]|uniref:energy transducer TonB n=1 Tax=Maricaulis sp. TaxID=1486257 RepID=UPI00329A374B